MQDEFIRKARELINGVKWKTLGINLIVLKKPDDTMVGGIFLPESAPSKQYEGVVIAAGAGVVDNSNNFRPAQVKSGDYIHFTEFAGVEIVINGETYVSMRESEVYIIAYNILEQEDESRLV